MIDRPYVTARVLDLFRSRSCVAILGPRQCGKTTLARMICASETVFHFFDLKSPVDVRKLEAPVRALDERLSVLPLRDIVRLPERLA